MGNEPCCEDKTRAPDLAMKKYPVHVVLRTRPVDTAKPLVSRSSSSKEKKEEVE
jgi:hypothetical protein